MGRLLFYRTLIQRIAFTDGLSPEDRDRLLLIAARSLDGCTQEDAERVAYILYRVLRPDYMH